MKNFLVLIAIVATSIGCQTKLEKARINMIRTWKVDMAFQGGQDVTSTFLSGFGNYTIHFNGDGEFTETYNPFGGQLVTIDGGWEFSDGISKFKLVESNRTRVYQIETLEKNALNVTDLGTIDGIELKMIPQ